MAIYNESPCHYYEAGEIITVPSQRICSKCRRPIAAGEEAVLVMGQVLSLGLIGGETPVLVFSYSHFPSCPVIGPRLVTTGKSVRCALCDEQMERGVLAFQDGRVWLHSDCLDRLKAIAANHPGAQLLQARGDETCTRCEEKLKKRRLGFKLAEEWYHSACLET